VTVRWWRDLLQKWFSSISSKYRVFVVVLFVASLGLSIYIHVPYPPGRPSPLDNLGLLYTDIVYGVFVPRFLDPVSTYGSLDHSKASEYWYNLHAIENLVYGRLYSASQCPVPYRDYKFEYPPLVAATWYLSTCTAYLYTYHFIKTPSNLLEYRSVVESYVIPIHFAIQVGVLLAFSVLTTVYLYKLLRLENTAMRLLLFFVLPSTVLYITYNWDVIAAAFTVMSLYFFIESESSSKRALLAGVLLGLAIATKVLPIFIAVAILYNLLQKMYKAQEVRGRAWLYSAGLLISSAIPYGIAVALSQKGFSDFLNHHLTWYCENCLYLPLVQDIHSSVHRILFFSLATVAILSILAIEVSSRGKLYTVAFLALSTAIIFNYVFSPQMMIMLTPIALLALPQSALIHYAIADVANALIMLMFFKDFDLRAFISKYTNIRVAHSPWTLDSPVQWAAFIRNLMLLIIFLSVLHNELKSIGRGANTPVGEAGHLENTKNT